MWGEERQIDPDKQPNKYIERAVREAFGAVAQPIVGQTRDLDFLATPEEEIRVIATVRSVFVKKGILPTRRRIRRGLVHNNQGTGKNTCRLSTNFQPGEYSKDHLDAICSRAYDLARDYKPKLQPA